MNPRTEAVARELFYLSLGSQIAPYHWPGDRPKRFEIPGVVSISPLFTVEFDNIEKIQEIREMAAKLLEVADQY